MLAYCHPTYFNFYAKYIMINAGLSESKAGIKIAGRNVNNLRYANGYHSNSRKWRGTKESLDKGEKQSEKAGLKLNNKKKTKILASGPNTSWKIDGEKGETVTDLIFLGSKATVDSDCSHETKRPLLLRRKTMTPRQCIKKQRHHSADKDL